jgi:hypothetical protein
LKTNKKSEGEKIKDGLKNEESDWCNSEIINKIIFLDNNTIF